MYVALLLVICISNIVEKIWGIKERKIREIGIERKLEESNPEILFYHLLNCESRIKNKMESNVEVLRKFGIEKRKIREIEKIWRIES